MAKGRITDSEDAGPKYKQIYSHLRRALTTNEYSPGDKLPSENELVERFGASRRLRPSHSGQNPRRPRRNSNGRPAGSSRSRASRAPPG